MNHTDHVNLLRRSVVPGGVWADFGSGSGAFTLALAELLGPGGEIYSVDKDRGALREQERAMQARFSQTTVHYLSADFTQPLKLPPLDGLVLANALHFQKYAAQGRVIQLLKSYLRPGGRLILIEYNVDQGNLWVPHPLSYQSWEKLARECGFVQTQLLATVPSRFLREIYAAASW
ncbi:MAG: class I SAM-dependent methyltransferase [Anaerolineae bacterium]|nr:class I SAM-dependent methyltransferase [Anaerolineales bacterium]MCQ3973830.1 class I SAM-dependent methyltransferase [Anaerolineae bacterium]